MLQFLTALEESAFSQGILESLWWIPILLCAHAIGMSFLAGTLMMIDLRLLGLGRRIESQPLRKYFTIVWFALALNFASGVLLFVGYAVDDYYSMSFRIKLLLIVVGLVIAWTQQRDLSAKDDLALTARVKVLAVLSLVCWIGTITAGRLIAYTK